MGRKNICVLPKIRVSWVSFMEAEAVCLGLQIWLSVYKCKATDKLNQQVNLHCSIALNLPSCCFSSSESSVCISPLFQNPGSDAKTSSKCCKHLALWPLCISTYAPLPSAGVLILCWSLRENCLILISL